MKIKGQLRIADNTGDGAVALAVADLVRDAQKVLGVAAVVSNENPHVAISFSDKLNDAESFRIEAGENVIAVEAADRLGAIYGVYHVSHNVFGVDPLWFWKGIEPLVRECVEVGQFVYESKKATFKYRGWFINDEDLLTEWKDGSGKRFIDYPYYSQVISQSTADAVYEACLRCGCNLLIPASFVDVMNEPEANLVRRAVARGLYVTQHHIEPLGVSHFGFENFWKARGEEADFNYGSSPEKVRTAWQAYAGKWFEIAGENVVWQLGLRGKGDRAVWESDPTVTRESAGGFISRAMDEQWNIVKSVDSRPTPPATTTLWAEGSELMAGGELEFPENLTIVFSDHGVSQTMSDDFYKCERLSRYSYGVYYHVAYWICGPHLVQGIDPHKTKRIYNEVVACGDTEYSILNVSSIREHCLGTQATSEVMRDHAGFYVDAFLREFAPSDLDKSIMALIGAHMPIDGRGIFQDGDVVEMAHCLLDALREGNAELPLHRSPDGIKDWPEFAERLDELSARLGDIADSFDPASVEERMRDFLEFQIRTQARILRDCYAAVSALMKSLADDVYLAEAEKPIVRMLEERKSAERGKWEDWYRGETKADWKGILEQIREVAALDEPAVV